MSLGDPPASGRRRRVRREGLALPALESQRPAIAAWVALTAPGLLLTRAIATLALIIAPSVVPSVSVAASLRAGSLALLGAYLVCTLLLLRWPQRWSLALAFFSVLLIDAHACGILIGADPQFPGAALPLAGVVLALNLAAGGWSMAALSGAAVAIGCAAASWCGLTVPLIRSGVPVLSTVLSLDLSFAGAPAFVESALLFAARSNLETFVAGAPALENGPPLFSTALSVETIFAGVPALARSLDLFLPALAVALVALCAGIALNLLRTSRARAAVATEIMSTATRLAL